MATRKSIRSTASTAASRKKANQAIKANSTKPVVAKATSSNFAGPSLPGKVQPGYYDYSNKAKVEQDSIINKKNNSKSSNNSSKSSSNKSKNATAAKVQGDEIQNPEPIQNNITSPPPQQAGMPGSGQSLGAGKYSNGALLKNNPAEDNYIKELRKAYSGDGGMKELRNQFKELIKQLDPTYDALQKEGTEALNTNLIQNSNQLASVMNAGNVGDSEQRTQQLAGLQNNNTTALGNLLAKLAQGKASDVSNYRSQLQGNLSDAQQRNQSNQQRLMEAINSYRNQQEEKQYKYDALNKKSTGGSGPAGAITYMGNNSKGEPVYRNSKTGALQVGTGLTKGNNDLMSLFTGMYGQGQQQGGSWETDPQTGEKIWVTD